MKVGRYDIQSLRKGLNNPKLPYMEAKRISLNHVRMIKSYQFHRNYGQGVDFMEKEWDNLIILDGMRHDYFERFNSLDGELSPIVSKGAHSWEFMEGNFVGKELHDTVYVTTNGHTSKLTEDIFYTVNNLFADDDIDLFRGAVRSEDVVKAAAAAHESYPNKRLIIHLMDPHGPHLGPTAEKYRERLEAEGYKIGHVDGMIWSQVASKGLITQSEAQNAYAETVQHVLDHVDNLLDVLTGKSVITADHGQMLGERLTPITPRVYGHPHNLHTSELCVVPWFEPPFESRRETYPEDPVGYETADKEEVTEQLQALGYVT
jgi:hypothetical protein